MRLFFKTPEGKEIVETCRSQSLYHQLQTYNYIMKYHPTATLEKALIYKGNYYKNVKNQFLEKFNRVLQGETLPNKVSYYGKWQEREGF